ncbi:MAG: TMEM175 family protein [Ekhidna sp.]
MKTLKDQLVGLDPRFNYRGLNQTRVETFSDAVFAFAFTLVVLSSSVPETFTELKASLREIIPFLICIVLIVVIWYQHYIFFLRYGLQNTRTVVINTFLLFLLLIYVYPLKFLASFLFELYAGLITGDSAKFNEQYVPDMDGNFLMTSYGIGATLIFLTIALLYKHAISKREELGLNKYEVFATKNSCVHNLLMASVPFLSFIISVSKIFGDSPVNVIVAGFIYMLYIPVMFGYGWIVKRKLRRLDF